MNAKQLAGEKAAEYIKDGMIVGLGTGSTAYFTILKLAEMIKQGLNVRAVSTSSSTTNLADGLGIPLCSLHEVESIDLTIDGADEIDSSLNGIKGGGGALLHEKLVAVSSKEVIWVADSSKKVEILGKFPLPVEVVPFCYQQLLKKWHLEGMNPTLRYKNGSIFRTDENNYIIDLHMGSIKDSSELHRTLKLLPGVVETGLFLDIADAAILGHEEGIEIIKRK